MRYFEITAPATHPYTTRLHLDPADLTTLERLTSGRDEVRILGVDSRQADVWIVYLGCASEAVAERMQDGWG